MSFKSFTPATWRGTTAVDPFTRKQIVRATGGEVSPHDLFPETFPSGFEFPPELQTETGKAAA